MSNIAIVYDFENDELSINATEDFPGDIEVYRRIGKMIRIHARKSHDYGLEDKIGNFNFSEKITGVPAWLGAFVRMTDKWGRLRTLMTKPGFVEDESFEDTLIDNAVYSIIVAVLRGRADRELERKDDSYLSELKAKVEKEMKKLYMEREEQVRKELEKEEVNPYDKVKNGPPEGGYVYVPDPTKD